PRGAGRLRTRASILCNACTPHWRPPAPGKAFTYPWVRHRPPRGSSRHGTASASWMPSRWRACCRGGYLKFPLNGRIWRHTAPPSAPHCAGKRSRRMPHTDTPPDIAVRQGIRIETAHERALPAERDAALAMLRAWGLHPYFVALPDGPCAVQFEPAPALLKLAPQRDTTGLCTALGLDTHGNADDLAREIVLAMLLGPEPFPFPGAAEMRSA